jgi:hypothetical protein
VKRSLKIVLVAAGIITLIAGAVLMREYLLLRRIQATILSGTKQNSQQSLAAPSPATWHYVQQVRFSEGRVEAMARFAAFKKTIEANPRLLAGWGTLGWKVLGDIPALCIRSLAASTPFAPLGVTNGECITHIDGETINQPLRNLAIWMTLSSRSNLRIDTLRAGKRISYHLVRL